MRGDMLLVVAKETTLCVDLLLLIWLYDGSTFALLLLPSLVPRSNCFEKDILLLLLLLLSLLHLLVLPALQTVLLLLLLTARCGRRSSPSLLLLLQEFSEKIHPQVVLPQVRRIFFVLLQM